MTKQTQTQKLVYGKGMNDFDGPIYKNGRHLKFYHVWESMIRRCYSKKCQSRQPTYNGCSVCSEWLSLSNFKEWFDINYREGMALDKDILIQGNKIYSPEACRFVPQYINSLLTDAGASRGKLPLGVSAQTNTTYRAKCWDGHGGRPSETFRTISEAAAGYSVIKKKVACEQAIRAFGAGDITEDVYQALITREW